MKSYLPTLPILAWNLFALLLLTGSAKASDSIFYDMGQPQTQELWVDPVSGNDSHSGLNRSEALRSLTAAWNRIPASQTLSSSGYRIRITPGELSAAAIPNYWEHRWGTRNFPILIEAADGPNTVIFRNGPNVFDTRYLYFVNLSFIPNPAGDAFHCERCDHVLLRGMNINGGSAREAQETVKVNQSQNIFIESSDIQGAHDNVIDFVSVQYAHIVSNRIHNAEDWCLYTKGGSSNIRIERNEIFDCGTGGYTAGQGTGLEYIDSPWLHFEAYDVKFVNNIVHDTEGAGLGVNGGYNILLAFNTLYRVGRRSHGIEVVFGERSCDGLSGECSARVAAGGWGPGSPGTSVPIPNRNVFIANNVLYNPPGVQSAWQHFAIYGPRVPPPGSNVPSPATTDSNLRIQGNVIWNGPPELALGLDESTGCLPSNPSCNQTQLVAQNHINSLQPDFQNFTGADVRPGPALAAVSGVGIENFSGADRETQPLAPLGELSNAVLEDFNGNPRTLNAPLVGALLPGSSSGPQPPPSQPPPGSNPPDSQPPPPDLSPQIVRLLLGRANFTYRGGRLTVNVYERRGVRTYLLVQNQRTSQTRRYLLRADREGRDGVRRFSGSVSIGSNRLPTLETYRLGLFLQNRYGDRTQDIGVATVSPRRRR